MLQAVQFMSVRQRLYYNVCIFIYKAVNGRLPKELKNKLQIVGSRSSRVTRQAGDIVVKFRRTRSAQKSMYYEGVNMYNALPTEVKNHERIEQYKQMLKQYILSIII